jgi:hypothetical protein
MEMRIAMKTDAWWEHLTPEEMARYGGLIDSRVRLLGDYYGNAVEYVREHQRDQVILASDRTA